MGATTWTALNVSSGDILKATDLDNCLAVNSDGYVGIGVNSPTSLLHLQGGISDTNATMQAKNSTGSAGWMFQDESGTTLGGLYFEAGSARSKTSEMYLSTGGNVEAVRVNSYGYVGIGTNAPQDIFHIQGKTSDANQIIQVKNSTGIASISFQDESGTTKGGIQFEGGSGRANANHAIFYSGSNTEAFRIDDKQAFTSHIKYENLIVKRASTTTVDIDADYVTVYDSNGRGKCISSVDLTVSLASSGDANLLDTGSATATTWYYLWVIHDGTTTAGLASTSKTLGGLTMPGSYTMGKLVGACYVTSIGPVVIRDFKQFDDVVIQDGTDQWVLNGGTATSFSSGSISFANEFPKIVKTATVGIAFSHTSSDVVMALSPVSDGSLGVISHDIRVGGNSAAMEALLTFDQSNASYPIYYYTVESGDTGYLGYTNQFTIKI